MVRRDCVTFAADFPDDSEWDDQGTEVVPGGKAIVDSITSRLQEQDVPCSDADQHSDYGWAFDAVLDSVKVRILLAAAEEGWLIQLTPRLSLMTRLFGSSNRVGFKNLQTKIHDILTRDERFSNVLWYAKADYDSSKEDRASSSPHRDTKDRSW